MSYTKHTWTDGELVTAAKMNNIENGIEEASSGGGGTGGGVLVVHDVDGTLDKTWQEIHDADLAVIRDGDSRYPIHAAYQGKGTYVVSYFAASAGNVVISSYSASSMDGYPSA